MTASTNSILPESPLPTEKALALFDSLEPVGLEQMFGRWRGEGFPTHHPMDGLLEAYHWYGKEFRDPDHVDPLVFTDTQGRLFRVNPAFMPTVLATRLPFLKSPLMSRAFALLNPLVRTRRARARLRMTEYRGKISATMIYDQLPINDVFRRIDDNTVLGVMDLKDVAQPFFFLLRRVPA